MQRWQALFPFLRDQVIESVAAVHGMDEDTLLGVLGEPLDTWVTQYRPPWLGDLETPSTRRFAPTGSISTDGSELVGFLSLAAPWIEQARERLDCRASALLARHGSAPCDTTFIVDAACRALPELLLPIIARTLVLELNLRRMRGELTGDTPRARFRNFGQQLQNPDDACAILREYPVLGRRIVEALGSWARVSLELFKHLLTDWKDLVARFAPDGDPGTLADVQWHKGDRHRRGQSVAVVATTSGLRVVYKPRSLAADVHFQELLVWLNHRGNHPPFPALKILDRGAYGWVEFVEFRECQSVDEVRRFYERQGAYLALLYVLEATDVHFDNSIACGEYPFLVDLETLFHPRTKSTPAPLDPASAALRTSVLRIDMLPHRSFASGMEEGIDLSAIGGAPGQASPFPIPTWQAVGTDEMRLHDDRPLTTERQNRPMLGGKKVDPEDFAESLASGFAAMYRTLREHRDALIADDGPLTRFTNDETRVVLRPTAVYASLRQASYHPDVLRDAVDRDALFGWLWLTTNIDFDLAKVAVFEAADLRDGDIPLFCTHPGSADIWTSSGRALPGIIVEPAMTTVRRKLADLEDTDLERQLWIIRASLSTVGPVKAFSAPRRRVNSRGRCDRVRLLEQAIRIGDRIADTAVRGTDGAVSWLGIAQNAKQHRSISPIGMGLYDGLSGVALFYAYLAHVTQERRFEELAREAVQTIRANCHRMASPGAFDGLAGIVYVLAHLGELWNDPGLLDEAQGLVPAIADQALRGRAFDVIGGSAGCIAAILALHRVAPAEPLLNSVRRLGDHLIAGSCAVGIGRAWPSPIASLGPLTGFGHGASGVGWALSKLYQLSRMDHHRRAALDAFAYERSTYSSVHRNWPDLRKLSGRREVSFGLGWCHGAPGILLARLRALTCLESAAVRAEIDEPLEHLSEAFGWGHCLCHGDLGNLEVLLEAQDVLDARRWCEAFEQQLSRTFESGSQNGWLLDNPEGLEAPGLMTGLSGVGFGLLRAADPVAVPSVLVLDPPRCEPQ
ncbi:MAG TPA: type 2 lanthipeptide synthetase LanM family protein [Coriobacteriia bacterium]|nr:type 2 lanthipeptide synthetase LanM family protein [Coriobacteriia bacterium]